VSAKKVNQVGGYPESKPVEFESGINLWVKAYSTNYGNKARITVSYLEEAEWRNTLALWLNKRLCIQLLVIKVLSLHL
jgi:hypothetical protein